MAEPKRDFCGLVPVSLPKEKSCFNEDECRAIIEEYDMAVKQLFAVRGFVYYYPKNAEAFMSGHPYWNDAHARETIAGLKCELLYFHLGMETAMIKFPKAEDEEEFFENWGQKGVDAYNECFAGDTMIAEFEEISLVKRECF